MAKKTAANTRSRGSNKPALPVQTFTYYIPAPPYRKTGYREREFDKIIAGISQAGFDLVNILVQSVSTSESSGVFIICTLRPLNKKAQQMDLGQDIQEQFKLAHSFSTPDIILEDDEA